MSPSLPCHGDISWQAEASWHLRRLGGRKHFWSGQKQWYNLSIILWSKLKSFQNILVTPSSSRESVFCIICLCGMRDRNLATEYSSEPLSSSQSPVAAPRDENIRCRVWNVASAVACKHQASDDGAWHGDEDCHMSPSVMLSQPGIIAPCLLGWHWDPGVSDHIITCHMMITN